MMSLRDAFEDELRHRPVLLNEVIEVLKPAAGGIYVDGTFGAGGYSRAMLAHADCVVFAIDRDPNALGVGAALKEALSGRLMLLAGTFARMRELLLDRGIDAVDGVALDIGVSSMQLDDAARGFSFAKDGPLDMRMGSAGPSAADVVNEFEEADLRRILSVLGEEKRAHAVARAIVTARRQKPFSRTLELADVITKVMGPKAASERIHPATRSFQALRMFVNAELEELIDGLAAAELLLKPGGCLAVVSFHSLEDRIIKRFFIERGGLAARPSRHLPDIPDRCAPSFEVPRKNGVTPALAEIEANPRARSARLRFGYRTAAPAHALDPAALGYKALNLKASSW